MLCVCQKKHKINVVYCIVTFHDTNCNMPIIIVVLSEGRFLIMFPTESGRNVFCAPACSPRRHRAALRHPPEAKGGVCGN